MNFFMYPLVIALGLFCNSIAYAETFVVTEMKTEEVVTMAVGDTLDVVLQSNPSTGYCWKLEPSISPWLVLADTQYKASSSLMGAPGFSTFHFVALSPGKCEIFLEYKREWEKDVPPIKTFAVSICIEQK
jgi:inhibitor of cysteine peptidase